MDYNIYLTLMSWLQSSILCGLLKRHRNLRTNASEVGLKVSELVAASRAFGKSWSSRKAVARIAYAWASFFSYLCLFWPLSSVLVRWTHRMKRAASSTTAWYFSLWNAAFRECVKETYRTKPKQNNKPFSWLKSKKKKHTSIDESRSGERILCLDSCSKKMLSHWEKASNRGDFAMFSGKFPTVSNPDRSCVRTSRCRSSSYCFVCVL